ncbi:type IV pilus modification protein PilV [Neisseria sp.]|uniref:type IV pilus modification protein PilV n=1 Tax=Neisseria sp. TaxID=192066 RepID=UPI0026DC9E41|nr:type IV pilus modification protein PilV [Neisseria sp.]MDO4906984.1 type IV pilus modification protein PilV [Neisseria sp.]
MQKILSTKQSDKDFSGFVLPNRKGRPKQNQSGMTLVEVVVAMFVLAIGVLALLATQLRTVSSVREAESQTVVAQAVQNLMEGMQLNPTLSEQAPGTNSEPTGWVIKRYDNNQVSVGGNPISYRLSNPVTARTCAANRWCNHGNGPLNKRQILEDQLGRFEDSLVRALPNATIQYVICNDTSGRDMSVENGTVRANCTGNDGQTLVIKVLWQMDSEQNDAASPALNSNGSNLVYTYQARMPD